MSQTPSPLPLSVMANELIVTPGHEDSGRYAYQGHSQDFNNEGARQKDCTQSARKFLKYRPHPLIKSREIAYLRREMVMWQRRLLRSQFPKLTMIDHDIYQ